MITNLDKIFKLRWKNWDTAWVNNTILTWKQLSGEAKTNVNKISIGETWATIPTTWASETRTWEAASKLINNVSVGITGLLWSIKRFPWTELTPWLDDGGITNEAKPI